MTETETTELLRLIAHFYPTRFDPPAPQRQLWAQDMQPYTPALALACLHEWVRWHGDSPPQIGEFTARCRTEAAKRAREAHEVPAVPRHISPDAATFAQLQLWLLERSVWAWTDSEGTLHPRLAPTDCAAYCDAWAEANTHRPILAEDLLMVAQMYRLMAAAGSAA